LAIAIGTGGASPALSARIRRELEARVGREYGPYVAILGAVRRVLEGEAGRADVLAALLDAPLLDLVRRGAREDIDRVLARVAGSGLRAPGGARPPRRPGLPRPRRPRRGAPGPPSSPGPGPRCAARPRPPAPPPPPPPPARASSPCSVGGALVCTRVSF